MRHRRHSNPTLRLENRRVGRSSLMPEELAVPTETIQLPSGHTAVLRTEVTFGDDMDLEGLASQIAAAGQMHQQAVPQANGRTIADIPQPTEGLSIADVPAGPGQTMSLQVSASTLAAQVSTQTNFPTCTLIVSWDFTYKIRNPDTDEEQTLPLPAPSVVRDRPRLVQGRAVSGQAMGLDIESLRMIPRLDGFKLREEAKRIWDAAHPDFSAVPAESEAESPFGSSSASV